MNLFIQLKDGMPYQHPILEDNFKQAFPDIDISTLPDQRFAKFERVEKPVLGPYEVYVDFNYGWVGNVVKDVHNVRNMRPEEKLEKQNLIKAQWAMFPAWSSWTFNEQTAAFEPPVPLPTDGQKYVWDEPTISWKLYVPPA